MWVRTAVCGLVAGDYLVVGAIQLVGNQYSILGPDDPIIGDLPALKQQEQVQSVLALATNLSGDNL